MQDADQPVRSPPSDEELYELGECLPYVEGTTSYRVTDLVLHSTSDLTVLAEALQARGMIAMQRAIEWHRTAAGELMWAFQAGFCGESFNGPEVEIAAMLAVVESLDPRARALWDNCSLREFDFAYDCGVSPFAVHHDLSAGTMARLAAAGASLRITLYACDPREIKTTDPGAAPDPGCI
jgi:hypothetical protein